MEKITLELSVGAVNTVMELLKKVSAPLEVTLPVLQEIDSQLQAKKKEEPKKKKG